MGFRLSNLVVADRRASPVLSRQLTPRTTVALDQLADALDAGQSDALTALLRAMSALDRVWRAREAAVSS